MITAYDDSIKEVVAEDVVKSEEVVEEPTVTEEETEVVEPEAVEETVEETPAEDVVKSEDEKEDKEADKEEAEKSDEEETDEDKKEETKKSTEEPVEEPVVKSEDKEDEKKETEKSDEEDEEDEKEDKDEDKKDKKDVKKSDEPEKEDEEEVLKSSDILGAFEVIFKGLATITENQAKLTEQLTGLVTKQEEVAKSLEETPVAKELTTGVVDVEGKAVSFVQKSVDVEAPAEVVETEEVAELEVDYNNPDIVTQEAYKLRKPFMEKFETVASNNKASKGELDSIRYTFSSLGQGYGSAQDLQAVKDFIDKDYK